MFKFAKKAGLFVCLLFVCASLWAADLDQVMSELEAASKSARDQIKSMKILAETRMNNEGESVETEVTIYQKGDKIRSEVHAKDKDSEYADALEATVIINGNDMWFISPVMGTQKMPAGQLSPGSMQGVNDNRWINQLKDKMELDGEQSVEGIDCYVLSVKGDMPMKLYIAKDGGYWVKVEQTGPTGEKIEVLRSNFKDVADGVKMGYRTDMKMGGTVFSTTIIKSVEVNPDLSDSLFVVNETSNQGDEADIFSSPTDEKWDALKKLKE